MGLRSPLRAGFSGGRGLYVAWVTNARQAEGHGPSVLHVATTGRKNASGVQLPGGDNYSPIRVRDQELRRLSGSPSLRLDGNHTREQGYPVQTA
jgi:hypothetical protein